MRKDILVAVFLLSIIDRFVRDILLVCVNNFYRWKRYTDVGGDWMVYHYNGKTYETIKELAEEYGVDRQRNYSFRRRGGSLENAMRISLRRLVISFTIRLFGV